MHPSESLRPEERPPLFALHVVEKYPPGRPLLLVDHHTPLQPVAKIETEGNNFKFTDVQGEPGIQIVPGTRGGGARWAAVYSFDDKYALVPVAQAPGALAETIQTHKLPPPIQNMPNGSKGYDVPFQLHYIIASKKRTMWKYTVAGLPEKPGERVKPTLRRAEGIGGLEPRPKTIAKPPTLTPPQQELLRKTTRAILHGEANPVPKPPDQKPDVPRPPDAQKIEADALALLRKLDITEQRVDVQPVDSLQKPRRTLTDLATIGIKPNLYTLLLPHSKELVRLLKPRTLRRGTTEARITRSTHTLIKPDTISVKHFNPDSGSRLDQEPIGISWYDSHIIFTGPLESLEHFLDVAIHSK